MSFQIFDYVNTKEENEITTWSKKLEKKQLAKLNERLDKLSIYGDQLYPQILTDTDERGIQKLRIHGNVQLRPLLCRGPINTGSEYTILQGAKEIGGVLDPKKVLQLASKCKTLVKSDSAKRRIKHERVG